MLRITIAVSGFCIDDLPRGLHSIQMRHRDIHHHHVRLFRSRHVDRLPAIRRFPTT